MATQPIISPTGSDKNTEGEIVLYQPNDSIRLEVKLREDTVWLTQQQMALLFGKDQSVIARHIQNAIQEGELDENSNMQILHNTLSKFKPTKVYSLDVIISVGYRVHSSQGVAFRRWATQILKEYMLRGYAVNQRLLAMEERIDRRLTQHDHLLAEHQEKIDFFVRTNLPPVEQVFFDGEFWEARVLLEKLIKTATKHVVIIDNYIDASDFSILDVRNIGVAATIYSHKDYADLRELHNAQPHVEPIRTFVWSKPSHDRWLIVDNTVYHCGHSLKDMGKKMCAISRMGCDAETILNQVK